MSCSATPRDADLGELNRAASEQASVRVEMVEMPTYVPGPDSPFPDYQWTSGGHLERYPYSLRMDMSAQAQSVKQTAVILENRYIRVTLLPEIGGRVYSMFDKIGGKECFMTPPSLKYQNISQRGAWLAGGIEFNAGFHHHTVNSVFPVSWTTQMSGRDGEVSLWVGSLTMPIESRWSVKISLKPERAVMDFEIHYQAPDALPGLYYWWTNAAVEVTADSRFYYFGKRALHHGWPICDGLDYSWYRNRLTGSDMFLMECQRDYLGFYDFSRNHGVANTADKYQAPGQKYFTWGNHQLGRYWDIMFSDSGQTYCEIQRGRHVSQGVNDYIDPMTEDTWTESWAPLNNTNGFSAFENDFVLSVVSEGKNEIRLVSLRPRKNLRVEAFAGEKSVGQWAVADCSPEKMFTQPLTAKCDRLKILDEQAQVLLEWEEFQYVTDDQTGVYPPPNQPVAANPETADSLFHEAQWQRFIYWPRHSQPALDLLNKALAMDGGHVGALQAMAEILLYDGLYAKALEHINKALLRAPTNGSLLCLQGRALLAMGKAKDAVDSFAQASRREMFRRRGCIGMAEAAIATGDWTTARRTIDRLFNDLPYDKWGNWLKGLIARRQGDDVTGRGMPTLMEVEKPSNLLWNRVHAETLLAGDSWCALGDGKAFIKAMESGDIKAAAVATLHGRKLADDSISAAMPYIDMGLFDDAEKLLLIDESNEPLSQAVRLAHLAYVQEKLGRLPDALANLKAANAADTAQANPWHTRSIDILQDLLSRHGDLPMLHLLLGNILASRNRLEEAKAAWQKAADLKMPTSVVYRNLGCVAVCEGHKAQAVELYEKAWKLSTHVAQPPSVVNAGGTPAALVAQTPSAVNGDLNLFNEFDHILGAAGLHQRRQEVYEQLPAAAKDRSMVATRRVQQLLDLEQYEAALKELMSREFFRAELEYGTRYFYLEALLGLAMESMAARQYEPAIVTLRRGLEYPRNINIGRGGIFRNESMVYYFLGLCYEAMGQQEQAREHFLQAAHEPHWEYHVMEAYEMLAWLALGERFRAIALAHKLEEGYRKHAASWWGANHAVNFGLAQAAKGHPDVAKAMWQKTLAGSPDGRYLRLCLHMPDWVLVAMGRKES